MKKVRKRKMGNVYCNGRIVCFSWCIDDMV